MPVRRSILAGIAAALVVSSWLYAQVATGNIRGTVSDASGAVIPNCSVTITNTEIGDQRVVKTNETGDFNAPSLPIGTTR